MTHPYQQISEKLLSHYRLHALALQFGTIGYGLTLDPPNIDFLLDLCMEGVKLAALLEEEPNMFDDPELRAEFDKENALASAIGNELAMLNDRLMAGHTHTNPDAVWHALRLWQHFRIQ